MHRKNIKFILYMGLDISSINEEFSKYIVSCFAFDD